MKQEIIIHKDRILDIIELKENKICSYSKDGKIRIIKLTNNNYEFNLIERINLIDDCAIQILFFQNVNFLCYDPFNRFIFFKFENNQYNYKKLIEENDKILTMKKLDDEPIEPNGKNENFYKIVYICENKEGNKKVKFIKFNNKGEKLKEYNSINIQEEPNKKLKLIDLLVFNNYIIVGYNTRIDFFNYKEKKFNISSLKFFDFEIINIITLSSNKIILGLYNSEKKESIIREHLLRIKDLQNNIERFDCIGQGILESKKIDNIIKINEAQILTNVKTDTLIIYERKNEISEKLKESLNLINDNNKELIEKAKNDMTKTEKMNNYTLLRNESFIIKSKVPRPLTEQGNLITNDNTSRMNQDYYSNKYKYNNNPSIKNTNHKYYLRQNSSNFINFNCNNNSNSSFSQLNETINLNKNNFTTKETSKKINNEKGRNQNLENLLPQAYKGTLVDNNTNNNITIQQKKNIYYKKFHSQNF